MVVRQIDLDGNAVQVQVEHACTVTQSFKTGRFTLSIKEGKVDDWLALYDEANSFFHIVEKVKKEMKAKPSVRVIDEMAVEDDASSIASYVQKYLELLRKDMAREASESFRPAAESEDYTVTTNARVPRPPGFILAAEVDGDDDETEDDGSEEEE